MTTRYTSTYLNTTFVSLQLVTGRIEPQNASYLNTTFVSLQHFALIAIDYLQINLNTTFVSLQPLEEAKEIARKLFKYNFCFSSTFLSQSIHPFLIGFKYNFCFSSTIHTTFLIFLFFYLNTTFVSLQLLYKFRRKILYKI